MIDTLLANYDRLRKPDFYDTLDFRNGNTLYSPYHRPANVDEAENSPATMREITDNVHGLPILFPIHPRTAKEFSPQTWASRLLTCTS